MNNRGRFVVVDYLDGAGKGVLLDTLVEEAQKEGKYVVDINGFWKANDYHPTIKELHGKVNVLITSEPTFTGIGKVIRDELIANNERHYSPEAIAGAYALDRQILYQRLVLPALEAGLDVYQSRSFSTSLVYQRQQAIDERRTFGVKEILALPGNAFCAAQPMDFLIIPTLKDVNEAIRRSQSRAKQDNCKFENLDFQLKLKAYYESDEFRTLFEKLGVTVIYMDVGKTIEFSKQQMREFYEKNLKQT